MKTLTALVLVFLLLTTSVNASKEAIVDQCAHKIAESFVFMSKTEQAKAAHDYLIQNVKFDYSMSENSFTAYGALVERKAVCQGYSFAYYEILIHLDIPCNIWIGTTSQGLHAWNFIKIDDRGYFVDVTWDDKDNGRTYYEYFMIAQIPDHYVLFTLY
jgi:transglutaminase/protease-like cytokinesis protein 3